MDHNLNLLGIARKAGLIAVGSDSVGTAARIRKAQLIFSTCDASDGAIRRARIAAEESIAVYITVPYTKYEIGNITGRGSPGTVAFLDAGLAAGFVKGLADSNPEHYQKASELLAEKARATAERKKRTSPVKRQDRVRRLKTD